MVIAGARFSPITPLGSSLRDPGSSAGGTQWQNARLPIQGVSHAGSPPAGRVLAAHAKGPY